MNHHSKPTTSALSVPQVVKSGRWPIAVLTRISDGAEPVLMAEEIEDFLDKTEIDN